MNIELKTIDMQHKKSLYYVFGFLLIATMYLYIFVRPAYAHCPLCVAGAGVGLTLSRLLGIDDSITGIWIGSFLGASSMWFENVLKSKYAIFAKQFFGLILYVLIVYFTLVSFYKFNLISTHGSLFGYDKLTVGIVLGSIVFYLANLINGIFMKVHQKSFFPYQRLVFSLGSIMLLSVGMFILINYFI